MELFINVLNRSITASWIILVVIFLRMIFKNAPRWIYCIMWGIVQIRLLVPITLKSVFSLIPSAQIFDVKNIYERSFEINTGISFIDSFVNNIIGVRYSTTSNLSFSANLTNGCFIVADFENDGDWDHCGFVTQSDSYKGSYGYYDYKVAQHTSDYLGWASLDKNNWEKIGGDGGKYARVRN